MPGCCDLTIYLLIFNTFKFHMPQFKVCSHAGGFQEYNIIFLCFEKL